MCIGCGGGQKGPPPGTELSTAVGAAGAYGRWPHLLTSMIEYADSFRENLRHPSRIVNGHYETPLVPGYSPGYTNEALVKYVHPAGSYWQSHKSPTSRRVASYRAREFDLRY